MAAIKAQTNASSHSLAQCFAVSFSAFCLDRRLEAAVSFFELFFFFNTGYNLSYQKDGFSIISFLNSPSTN